MKSKIFSKFTILSAILFQTIQLYNCQAINTTDILNTNDITQLINAKLIKSELLDIIKNAEKLITSLDEWAIEKTVNLTQTDQISREYIEQVENDIIKLQSKVNEFQNKSRGFTGDIDELFNEKNIIEREFKSLNEKFERFFGKNLKILGEFYDNHYSEIIDKKDLLHSDVTRLTAAIDRINRNKEMNKLLNECAGAIQRGYYSDVIIKLKLLNNYENDLKVIIEKLYGRLPIDVILEFANNIDNLNISILVYQQILSEINELSDQEKIKVLQKEQRFVHRFGRAGNILDVLIEPWKDLIKMYLNMTDAKTLDDHLEVISEIIRLDEKLLPKALEEVFEEMINSEGRLANDHSRILSTYFNAIKRIIIYLNKTQSDIKFIIYFGNQIKNQLAILKTLSNFSELINAFPSPVRSLIFSDYVCFKNRDGQYLKSSDTIIDGFKRLIKLSKDQSTAWKIKQYNFTTFEIISEDGTSLCADYVNHSFGHYAYTNKNCSQIELDTKFWSFDYNADGVFIKNKLIFGFLAYNEDIALLKGFTMYGWFVEHCKPHM